MRFLLVFLAFASQLLASTVMVIFGATGDLTQRKIIPAVDSLSESLIPVGFARRSEEEFRKQSGHPMRYVQGDFDSDGGYDQLRAVLDEIGEDRIYFLATEPKYFASIIQKLHQHELITPSSRVMIEKPFGHDLESALELQEAISQYLEDSQIYRIDHYLGKEGVQRLVEMRLKGDLEPVWNREFIKSVKITLAETIGVGTRGKFWEETGMLRDVVQNHLMQLLSLFAMEMGGDRAQEKVKVIEALRIESIERGQYGPGLIHGVPVVGYNEEAGVPKDSNVETFVRGELYVDNERWEGVPFFIEAGKRLSKQLTEITVTFKSGEILPIRIQPLPSGHSDGYAKLIADCTRGDRSSFVEKEEQFAAWKLLTPVLENWKREGNIVKYPAGSDL